MADFCLAKLLVLDFSRVLATVRGTPGYLALEWFSEEAAINKTDVFSHGVIVIEILSGRRN